MIKKIKEYCPITQENKTLEVEYQEIPMCNTSSRQFKAISHNCGFKECPLERCEILHNNLTIVL